MNTKLIILEGMDNTGKTTLIEMYKRIVSGLNPDIKVQVIHMEKPPQDESEKVTIWDCQPVTKVDYIKINEFQHNAYMNLPDKLREIKTSKNAPDIIILDRAWISEYVYGYLYRNRNQHDIIIDNIIIEKMIMNIFGKDNVYLVYLYPSYLGFIRKREDGKSLAVLKAQEIWPADKDSQKRFIERRQKEELERFDEAFNKMSIIRNKIPIQCNKGETEYFDNSMIVQMFEAIHG